ncbi:MULTISPECIES: helix-turn-helix transcriptional regulator [unclassified Mycobacteroides]|nr:MULTISPECIES: helix-turn-helix transcriptional regulator [unclassified Mycobacteroides]
MVFGNSQGQFLRAVRDRAQMSQRRLASLTGYTVAQIQHYESGRRRLSSDSAELIARQLNMTPRETQYFHALGGWVHAKSALPAGIAEYLRGIEPHPAAWMDAAWKVEEHNEAFHRLLPLSNGHPNLIHWHYHSPAAREIIQNWDETSQWCVGLLRFSIAITPEDPGLRELLDSLMSLAEFRTQWASQIIPIDPATRPWVLRDVENGDVVTVNLRAWHTRSNAGMLLLGVVIDRQPEVTTNVVAS